MRNRVRNIGARVHAARRWLTVVSRLTVNHRAHRFSLLVTVSVARNRPLTITSERYHLSSRAYWFYKGSGQPCTARYRFYPTSSRDPGQGWKNVTAVYPKGPKVSREIYASLSLSLNYLKIFPLRWIFDLSYQKKISFHSFQDIFNFFTSICVSMIRKWSFLFREISFHGEGGGGGGREFRFPLITKHQITRQRLPEESYCIDMQKSPRREEEEKADESIIWPSTGSLVPADVAQRLTCTPRTPVSTRRVNICLALVR